MSEVIDIYDASLRPMGSMDRKEAHKNGQWHRTFHCWVFDPNLREIYFQVRSAHTSTHPSKLDVTAAGHLVAGEEVIDGVREVQEELGISVEVNQLVFAGQRVEVSDSADGTTHNREYQSVYFLAINGGLGYFDMDPKEVAGMAALGFDDAVALFTGRSTSITARTISADTKDASSEIHRDITLDDFIPRIQRYYLAATLNSSYLADGAVDVAIS